MSQEKKVGDGVPFQHIRRITGYLVGTMDRWNNAKRAEERDRMKHSMKSGEPTAPPKSTTALSLLSHIFSDTEYASALGEVEEQRLFFISGRKQMINLVIEYKGKTAVQGKRLTHELHRQMDTGSASEEELIQMALQCAAETYQDIHSARHITDRLTAVLQSAGPLSALDTRLLRATVRQIRLDKTGEIALLLKNGRIYKEGEDLDRNS